MLTAQSLQLPVEIHQAPGVVIVGQAMVLGQVADAPAYGDVADWFTEQVGLPLGFPGDPEQHFDQCRLARAVLSEQAEALAALDCHGDAAKGLNAAVVLVQGAGFDHGHANCPRAAESSCTCWANGARTVNSGKKRSLPSLPLRFLRLFNADEPVAVEVEALEIVVGAEELAARHVAVAVAVHVAEPEW